MTRTYQAETETYRESDLPLEKLKTFLTQAL